MKLIWSILPPFLKAVFSGVIFLVGVGWASYGAILLMVRAEGKEIEEKMMTIRRTDLEHIDKRFDQVIMEIRNK